jgi:hypothetical protein
MLITFQRNDLLVSRALNCIELTQRKYILICFCTLCSQRLEAIPEEDE